MARFFIDRPVLGVVISVVIMLAGLAALGVLPVAQYPEITPPTVQVSCNYPGASAIVVRDTVAAPIEQQVNGVERMLYMSSQSTNDGGYVLTVTFELGTNLDMAQVLVQNRVNLALPSLPDAVKAIGVSTKKKSPSILLVVNFTSEVDPATSQPRYDQLYLSNFATIQVKDELARLTGVGDVGFLGQQDYSMRVWLNPDRLASHGLTAGDVVQALQEQNVQVAAGQIGQQPVPEGQDFQYTLSTLGRLTEPEQFEQIIVKTGESGELVRLRDLSSTELGAKNQDTRCTLDGSPSVGLSLFQLPGSNALETADRIRKRMRELSRTFPEGVRYDIVYDTTPFIKESVAEVFHTLRDAVILVAIVVLLFLQDWRAMILPMIDVPVSLIGTFAVMYLMGFTLNNLTLFGLVLAIGIVVDDAIVVLEAVEQKLAEGLDARTATIRAMGEITGAIIAITLVLCSVFLPTALLGGISGQFYRQFALTIAASMIISAVNAMTMTPSRAVMIFRNYQHGGEGQGHHREALPWWGYALLAGWLGATLLQRFAFPDLVGGAQDGDAPWIRWLAWGGLWLPGMALGWWISRAANRILSRFFQWFNRGFDWVTRFYGRGVGGLLRMSAIVLLIYGGLIGLTYLGFTRIPTGFIPAQDKGYLVVDVQLPDSASLERTVAAVARIEQIALQTKGVSHTIGIPGNSFVLNAIGSNLGSLFLILDEFEHRHDPELYGEQIARKLQRQFYTEIVEAQVAVFGAPAVDGLGNAGGFKLMVKDNGDLPLDMLQGQAENMSDKGRSLPGIAGLFSSFRANTPQLYIDIDRTKCKSMQVPLGDVFNTLQVYLGGYYVNDFNRFGRTWQVNLQADAPYRIDADLIKLLKVRNTQGEMVPLGTLATIEDVGGPLMITRYNMRTAAALNGAALPGVSTGTVIAGVGGLAEHELAQNMTYEWTELTFLQLQEGSAAYFAFAGAVILVFLVLAAQYENYSLPLAVILVVPMCILSALVGVALIHSDINIFVQVGFIVLVGLACKNAILIVAFAKASRESGLSRFDATMAACRSRLRPIIMTSFAFVLGVVPLMVAHGAGAEMRRTLGTAVFAGMLGVTAFGIFLTPVFYYVIQGFTDWQAAKKPAPGPTSGD
ncbi:MAG: efflux RND transporter permease subunit [Planctomycetales bacterium]